MESHNVVCIRSPGLGFEFNYVSLNLTQSLLNATQLLFHPIQLNSYGLQDFCKNSTIHLAGILVSFVSSPIS